MAFGVWRLGRVQLEWLLAGGKGEMIGVGKKWLQGREERDVVKKK